MSYIPAGGKFVGGHQWTLLALGSRWRISHAIGRRWMQSGNGSDSGGGSGGDSESSSELEDKDEEEDEDEYSFSFSLMQVSCLDAAWISLCGPGKRPRDRKLQPNINNVTRVNCLSE
ncbi:hypothetical protein B0H17DRAFT_1142844 [Mycena rosella]|uniref:Uncharacterized protein n=1 Tax=Mycena rosella TaxID=1033263 RepID=A0AAD7CWC9_MYCRO|nr:hypothetical protein B0H17DRAFT_1142844 [Mycena rosella]